MSSLAAAWEKMTATVATLQQPKNIRHKKMKVVLKSRLAAANEETFHPGADVLILKIFFAKTLAK
jgi:hypothetical protein